MIEHLRPNIRAMAGYTPGEQPRDGAFVKLNTNENPYPPSPRVFEALREALTGDRLRSYPDPIGIAFPPDGRPRPRRRSRRHPHRQRLRRHPDHRHPRLRPRGRPDRLADAELPALPHARRDAGRPLPDRPLHRRLGPAGAVAGRDGPPDVPRQPEFALGNARSAAPSSSGWPSELSGPLVVDEAYADFADDNALELARSGRTSIVTRTLQQVVRAGRRPLRLRRGRPGGGARAGQGEGFVQLRRAEPGGGGRGAGGPGVFPRDPGQGAGDARPDDGSADAAGLRRAAEPGELRVVPPRRPAGEADLRGAETARYPGALHELRGRRRRAAHLRRDRRGDRPAAGRT